MQILFYKKLKRENFDQEGTVAEKTVFAVFSIE